ncbi:MAG TPA: hypothetical protein VHR66_21065 [Gemmataceae bacterium]|nr:hypothetical protein [Gemmataceae bacterium]
MIGTLVCLLVLNVGMIAYVNTQTGLRDPLFDIPTERFQERIAASDASTLKIAFLGSSRTGGGIRPSVVQETLAAETGKPCIAYNLHVPGNGPVGELVHWNRLLERSLRPDVVVIEITPSQFVLDKNGVPDEAVLLHGDRLTQPESRIVRNYGFADTIVKEYWEANLNPWFGFRFQLLGIFKPSWLPPNVVRHETRLPADLGWQRPFALAQIPQQFAAAIKQNRKLLFEPMQHARFDNAPAQALRDLIRSAHEHDTTVAVWVTPEASPIRAWYPPHVDIELAAFLNELRSTGAIVADGRTWLPDEAFSDGHHPVRAWSDEYSRKVTRAVVVPAVRSK